MKAINVMNKWHAELYDQEETQTDDINFICSIIGRYSKNILEVCCGSGRILVPLAKEGHTVSGFDMDDYMLERISEKSKDLSNINYSKMDAIEDDWGSDFDVIILAGNILINIVSNMNYKEAQKLFIKKAYDSLNPSGNIYIDFNCFSNPEEVFGESGERVIFEGFDSSGNYGKEILFNNKYDQQTQITSFKRKTEIITRTGEKIVNESTGIKHIPTLRQVHEWLNDVGFRVVEEYGDYNGNPISDATHSAIIWAEKVDKTSVHNEYI